MPALPNNVDQAADRPAAGILQQLESRGHRRLRRANKWNHVTALSELLGAQE